VRLRGTGVAPGIAVGPALLVEKEHAQVFRIRLAPEGVAPELARFEAALEATRVQLQAIRSRLESAVGTQHAYIFDAQRLMLDDPMLVGRVAETIEEQRVNAEWALRSVGARLRDLFDEAGEGTVAERGTDLDDVIGRIQANLYGSGDDVPSLSRLPEDVVLVAAELPPSQAAELDWDRVLAVVTDAGSQTHHTAILARSLGELLGADALVLFRNRSFTVFVVSSFLICIPLAFYYQMAAKSLQQTGVQDVAFTMSFGQMSEIGFMLLMPLFFKRLGVKWMLAVGMLAWVARYALFATGAPNSIAWMMIAGIVLHGICYDFFFVTGQIYTDQVAHKGIRSQAQGLLAMLTLGLGMFIGAQAAGVIEEAYTPDESRALSSEVVDLGARIAQAGESTAEGQSLLAEQSEKALRALQLVDWRMIWIIPAALAGLILLMFVAVFKNPRAKPA